MPPRGPSLTMVAPALNEEELLEEFVRKSVRDLSAVTDDFEIILVNDGSTDRTAGIADRLAREVPRFRVIHLPRNFGTGASIIPAYRTATKDWVFNNTVDAFFDTADLPRIVPHLAKAGAVSGYRTDLKANNPYQKLLTLVNYYLIRCLFGMPLRAYQTLQFHRREFVNSVCIEARSSFISPELLFKAFRSRRRIVEIPVVFHPRKAGTPKGGKPIHVYRSIRDIVSFWLKWRIGGRLRVPCPHSHAYTGPESIEPSRRARPGPGGRNPKSQ